MLDRNLKRWELALMFGLLCGLLGGFWLDREQTQLADRVIRFHVIANSDSPEDQALKLQVRDRVLAETETFYPGGPPGGAGRGGSGGGDRGGAERAGDRPPGAVLVPHQGV